MSKYHRNENPYVDHVHLYVTDLDTSVNFYKDIIGLHVLEESKQGVRLSADGKTALVTIEQPEGVGLKHPRSTGLYHVAFLLPSRQELGKFLLHLRDKQMYYGASDHEVSEAIYFKDPDGNGIEVYRDRLPSEWEWAGEHVKMKTDPLDEISVIEEAEGEWQGAPRETIIGHIHLHVSELADTQRFYEKGLGFQLMTTYPGALFMATGGYHHHLGLNIWNGEGAPAPADNSAGLHEFVIVYPNSQLLEEAVKNLKTIDVSVSETDAGYVAEDPSKNKIRLVAA